MQVDGLILAGGKSLRMGSNIASKAFVKLDNKPLIEHVITSIKPQVNNLYVSGSKTNLLGIEYPIIEDLAAKYSGPLAGLYSALASTFFDDTDYIVLTPCDGPFVPKNLVEKLLDRIVKSDADVCFVKYDGILQTTFSIWNTRVKQACEKAFLVNRDGGFKRLASELDAIHISWQVSKINPFFNINSKRDLNIAEAILCL